MNTIAISEELANQLDSEATKRGCSPQDLLHDFLQRGLNEDAVLDQRQLTSAQTDRLQESVRQMEREELVTQEEVDGIFNAFYRERGV